MKRFYGLAVLIGLFITLGSVAQTPRPSPVNTGAGGSGKGDVVGPGSATDNCAARFDGATGKLIQNSVVCIDDSGNVVGVLSIAIGSSPPSVTVGTGGVPFAAVEGTVPSVGAAAGVDICYADSTAHGVLCSFNNGSYLSLLTKCFTTITTGTTATLSTCFTVNQEATAGTGVTYTLPTAASGSQFCIDSGWNGSAADTGVLTLATSASGQFLVFTDGTLSATGGNVTSGGAARDGACVYGIDATHWMFLPHSGTWTKH